jgi:ubiquinone/menaquinone biosynthesis C-methylase UbiE
VSDSEYLLGMAPAEVRRLEQQHETWRMATEGVWRTAGFSSGQVLVDLGCGPGFTTLDLQRLVEPGGRVIAVDSSTKATAQLRASVQGKGISNVEIITSDINQLDMSAWRADGVFIRWLLCFLPDVESVLERAAAALRPGSTLAVIDYWNYSAILTEPCTPLFRKVFAAVYDSFADAGGSLDVAGRIPALLAKLGFSSIHIEPLCQLGGPGSPIWRWVSTFQDLYLPTLVEKGYLTLAELHEYQRWWKSIEGMQSLFFAPPLLGVGGVKK